jgi:hypothetical protein
MGLNLVMMAFNGVHLTKRVVEVFVNLTNYGFQYKNKLNFTSLKKWEQIMNAKVFE